jgi:hypothetical protein
MKIKGFLMIVAAFFLGYMVRSIIKHICLGDLVEGNDAGEGKDLAVYGGDWSCQDGSECSCPNGMYGMPGEVLDEVFDESKYFKFKRPGSYFDNNPNPTAGLQSKSEYAEIPGTDWVITYSHFTTSQCYDDECLKYPINPFFTRGDDYGVIKYNFAQRNGDTLVKIGDEFGPDWPENPNDYPGGGLLTPREMYDKWKNDRDISKKVSSKCVACPKNTTEEAEDYINYMKLIGKGEPITSAEIVALGEDPCTNRTLNQTWVQWRESFNNRLPNPF